MTFKSSLKSMIDNVVEFDKTMMTDCVACERRVVKPKSGQAAICDSCSTGTGFGTLLAVMFTGAQRPRRLSSALIDFVDSKSAK